MKGKGTILKTQLMYNSAGKSTGNCEILFASRLDAEKIVKQFNGLDADGTSLLI